MAYRQPSSIRVDTDLSHEEKRLVQERAKLKAELRQEYLRQLTDPHKHGSGGVLKEFERKCRSGEIAYKDRMFKMV
ncbi:hypothetical protein HPB50_023854 [Hyalomma asiaticum]|uniref:Uncharacterized protein n=1 Tax=Hyalomma asiaticum TaxID=266040 RepID=A0ACB7S5G6_HYAAI|nr:hypothetical protein HPB50_023854 [Hyalomma asiaticum]